MPPTQGFCYDDETGEVTFYNINNETGEPCVENERPPVYAFRKAESQEGQEPEKRYMKFPKGYITKTKKYQRLKANILAGSNQVSYRMLMIPTVMVFPGLACMILMVLEIFLHVKCHKKNRNLKDSSLYYRSPFHAVTSVFCAVCRDCDSASKIGQLQDQRRFRYDYFRGIAI